MQMNPPNWGVVVFIQRDFIFSLKQNLEILDLPLGPIYVEL